MLTRAGSWLLLLNLAISTFAVAEDRPGWPQWRGPTRDAVVPGTNAWPESLQDGTLNFQWSAKLRAGYSGPIVVGERVFVAETRQAADEVVTAYHRDTGDKLWEASWPGAMSVPFFAKANGDWIRSTPAYADGRLFVAGMRDVLVCLSAEDGHELWRVDFVAQFQTPLPAFGFVCSPLVKEGFVYVQAGDGLVKLDATNGAIVWRTLTSSDGDMMSSAFSSPIVATIGGHEQLVVQTREALAGVDLATGDVLWQTKVEAFRGMNILTPCVVGDRVITFSYGGGGYAFAVSRTGNSWSVEQAWSNRSEGYMSSPVVVDGVAYVHLKNQRLACVDLATGEDLWRTQPFGKYWSMVRNGDRILALDERGDLILFATDVGEYRELDRRHLTDQPAWGHLAVAGDQVFIRDLASIAVYGWTKP